MGVRRRRAGRQWLHARPQLRRGRRRDGGRMSDAKATTASAPAQAATAGDPQPAAPEAAGARRASRFDRSIVEGPLAPAVWELAWPTMLDHVIGGLQGTVAHALVGPYVVFQGDAGNG